MFKLFATLNAKLWWRSLQGVEIAAMIFYSVFIMLVVGQFLGIILLLLFTSDVTLAQQIYPWITPDIQLFANFIFVNSLWFSQIFFTKINRLRINENRKLLAYGMPVGKLSNYLNIAGFFHPLNLMFNFFWLMYLGNMAQTPLQLFIVVLFVFVNYGVINSLKWRFRLFSSEKFNQVGAIVGTIILFFILLSIYVDYTPYFVSPQSAVDAFLDWLYYSPGYVFYYIGSGLTGLIEQMIVFPVLIFLLFVANKDIIANTKAALLTPVQSTSGTIKKSQLSKFINWLGHEGGKYFYSVWNHKYSKIQLLITYVFVIPYIVILGDGIYIVGVFLTLIPIIFLMVMLTNMFGFENRELLLSLQLPLKVEQLVKQRITAALLVCLGGSSIVLIMVPIFITTLPAMIQVHLGIIMITLVFMHYIMSSSINNYKKIEAVSVMSVSNPVLPASITFTSVFIVTILGLFTFIIIEQYIWYHISAILLVNILLLNSLIKKLRTVAQPFKEKVIPRLWNEL